MKSRITLTLGVLAASVAMALSAGASAQSPAPAQGDRAAMHRQHRMEHMQMKVKERIAKMAARLEIKASQQGAWSEYSRALESAFSSFPNRPARDADAATVARARAEFAADRARKAAVISDATAKLQAVLAPEQRKVFDEMARRGGHRGMRGHRGMHGEHGMRGGERGGRGGWGGQDQRGPR